MPGSGAILLWPEATLEQSWNCKTENGQEKAPGRLSLFRLRGLKLTPHTPLKINAFPPCTPGGCASNKIDTYPCCYVIKPRYIPWRSPLPGRSYHQNIKIFWHANQEKAWFYVEILILSVWSPWRTTDSLCYKRWSLRSPPWQSPI